MSYEIERRFKVKRLPKEILSDCIKITQNYLKSPEGEDRRVRSINDETFFMAVKRTVSSDGLIRDEIEKEISREDYELFLHNKIGNTVKKMRYPLHAENGLIYELDIYQDILEGLLVVEVEFPNEELANNFVKPDWFGEEITSKPEYRNAYLAKHGMPKDYMTH